MGESQKNAMASAIAVQLKEKFDQQPYRTQQITAAGVCLFFTVVGLLCGVVSFIALPKCRYGDKECYFKVEVCAYTDISQAPATPSTAPPFSSSVNLKPQNKPNVKPPDFCHMVTKLRAIEGSSGHGAEQLAIPILAVLFSVVSPIVTFVGVLSGKSMIPAVETVKVCLSVSMLLLVIGCRAIQDKTFDCRWWNNNHHGNSQACHDGLSLYVVSAICLFLAQVGTTLTAIHFLEGQRWIANMNSYDL